jgi:hypothetical protein
MKHFIILSIMCLYYGWKSGWLRLSSSNVYAMSGRQIGSVSENTVYAVSGKQLDTAGGASTVQTGAAGLLFI